MADIDNLKSYHDLRGMVSPEAFTATMNFLAWHNRQKMTPMLEVWQALVVAILIERRGLDTMFYTSVKSFFEGGRLQPPKTITECREAAAALDRYLSGTDTNQDSHRS